MSGGAIDGLEEPESSVGVGWTEGAGCGIDGVGQLFVKVSALDDAEWLEEVFEQDVVIVGLGRFQVGIALGDSFWAGVGIDDESWHEVADVGPGDALAVVQAHVGVLLELILGLR